jgi:hypothetical protein
MYTECTGSITAVQKNWQTKRMPGSLREEGICVINRVPIHSRCTGTLFITIWDFCLLDSCDSLVTAIGCYWQRPFGCVMAAGLCPCITSAVASSPHDVPFFGMIADALQYHARHLSPTNAGTTWKQPCFLHVSLSQNSACHPFTQSSAGASSYPSSGMHPGVTSTFSTKELQSRPVICN